MAISIWGIWRGSESESSWQNVAQYGPVSVGAATLTFYLDVCRSESPSGNNYTVYTRLTSVITNNLAGSGYGFGLTGATAISGSSVWTFQNETILLGSFTLDGGSEQRVEAYGYNTYWDLSFNTTDLYAYVTVPAVTGHVDVNPEINGVSYPSGQSGFLFDVTGAGTASGVIDYNNLSATPGNYTATPRAKMGYTTTADSGTVAAGGNLGLVPKWSGVETAITLDSSGATSHGTTSVTGKFGNAMPTITPPSRTGTDFLGYFSQHGGQGTQYYKADGTSNATWDNSSGGSQTLYAAWDFHDFLWISQNGGAYTLCQVYVSQNGGAYTLVDAGSVEISQNGSSYTNIV